MFSSQQKKRIFYFTKITKENCLKSSIMKSFISSTSEEIDIDGMISYYVETSQNKTISAFHTNFYKFKQALCFKRLQRKTKIDSILKKCKSKFFRVVQEALKDLLEDYVSVPNLPQSFITNINININKEHLKHSLKDILKAFNESFDFDLMMKNIPYPKQDTIIKLMLMSYKDLFKMYIESKKYIEDCETIREKEGERFELLFRYVSKIFVQYYSMSKGNKTKPKQKNIKDNVQGNMGNCLQNYSDASMTEVESQKGFLQ